LNRVGKSLFIHLMLISFAFSLVTIPASETTQYDHYRILLNQNRSSLDNVQTADDSVSVFEDYFNSSLGYNDSLWTLESYENGSVSWIEGEYFNMTAKKHSYRALTSKQTFTVGKEVSFRICAQDLETVICIGWTNTTPSEWNYLFWNDSVYVEDSLNTLLLTHKFVEPPQREFKQLSGIDTSEFHTYRIVWNSSVIIAYADGVRYAAMGSEMPNGPLHFKIAITENHNIDTEGWVCLDSVVIREHHSMIQENPPFITLNSPGNSTLNLGNTPIDVVPVGSDGVLYWSWDGASTDTSNYPYNIQLPSSEGQHYLDVYCKDGYGYNHWSHVKYIFHTMVNPPLFRAAWISMSPLIDGVIQPEEWQEASFYTIDLVRADGSSVPLNISIGCDSDFLYIAYNSTIPSGHDSRASMIINGNPDGVYHGNNETPITSVYYTKRSPGGWPGYDELHILSETDGSISDQKLSMAPSGFLSESSLNRSNVHYEFRIPLVELGVTNGATIGISFMLFPSGMGVHNLFFPIASPWENASRLALLELSLLPSSWLVQFGFFIVTGFAGVVLVLGWTIRYKSHRYKQIGSAFIATPEMEAIDETYRRIAGIIQSYETITIERLALMANISERDARAIVTELISKKIISAKIVGEEVIRLA